MRPVFKAVFHTFVGCMKVSGMYARGVRNALDIRLTEVEIALDGLPDAFDGYTILHLSDLHADGPIDLSAPLAGILDGLEVDLCALTGDYRYRLTVGNDDPATPMAEILSLVNARDGCIGVLGNHDLATMIEPLERAGMKLLINDSHALRRGDDVVHLLGLDDVHAYQPAEDAADVLARLPQGFRILLLHSPELLDEAERAGVSLYLAGHTHGGQICFPGGRPILTNIRTPRRYASGHWQHGGMQGYTSRGVGVSVMPLRYFSRGEIALITLRQG